MPIHDRSIFKGMGEVLLSLAMKHCDSHQWASWLKVQNEMENFGAIQVGVAVASLLQENVEQQPNDFRVLTEAGRRFEDFSVRVVTWPY